MQLAGWVHRGGADCRDRQQKPSISMLLGIGGLAWMGKDTITEVRMDTGEIVFTRTPRESERQSRLPITAEAQGFEMAGGR